ncbi:MAG: HU family DNA-binding protein [Prevotella sp.]|nr:HU family DNA-binding protein [Candidatus Prevotella equi]
MALKYVIYQQKRKGGNNLFYGRAVHSDTITLSSIADRVQRNCSMKKSDVLAVLTEMVETMQDELHNSNKVKIDGLGTFYLSIKSSGAITQDEYNANENVKGIRVNFLAEGKKNNGTMSRTFTNGVKIVKATGSVK